MIHLNKATSNKAEKERTFTQKQNDNVKSIYARFLCGRTWQWSVYINIAHTKFSKIGSSSTKRIFFSN